MVRKGKTIHPISRLTKQISAASQVGSAWGERDSTWTWKSSRRMRATKGRRRGRCTPSGIPCSYLRTASPAPRGGRWGCTSSRWAPSSRRKRGAAASTCRRHTLRLPEPHPPPLPVWSSRRNAAAADDERTVAAPPARRRSICIFWESVWAVLWLLGCVVRPWRWAGMAIALKMQFRSWVDVTGTFYI